MPNLDGLRSKLNEEVKSKDDTPAEQYQQYTSSRISTCLITPTGKRINFTNYEYYTKDPEIIAYLDNLIKARVRGFTKGAVVTAEDINPMAALKRKHIQEFLDSQAGRKFDSLKENASGAGAGAGILPTTGVAN